MTFILETIMLESEYLQVESMMGSVIAVMDQMSGVPKIRINHVHINVRSRCNKFFLFV